MADLISRTAAIECAINAVDDWDGGWNPNRETVIRKYFEEVPAADAAPVVHGRWGENGDCSECGFQPWYERDIHTLSYCPNCGAKMDGDGDG